METGIAQFLQRRSETPRLHLRQAKRQTLAFEGRVKLSASSVQSSGAGLDEILVDKLSQDAIEALFRYPQDLQKLGDRQARSAANEIEDPMMRAPEAVRLEQTISVADKVAIGEKK